MKLNILQRIQLWGLGYAFVENRQHDGWREPMPFYYAVCPKHGGYVEYPHGRGWVKCPECAKLQPREAAYEVFVR